LSASITYPRGQKHFNKSEEPSRACPLQLRLLGKFWSEALAFWSLRNPPTIEAGECPITSRHKQWGMFVIVVDAQPVCRKRHCISAALLIVQSAPARASSLLLSLQHDFLKPTTKLYETILTAHNNPDVIVHCCVVSFIQWFEVCRGHHPQIQNMCL